MKEQNSNRTRIIGLRLTPDEYAKIEKKWKASTCRKLSDYVRRSLFDKPVVTTYRNSSQDDLMAELTRLRSELNAVGNNFNQAVKKLHTLSQIAEFKSWLIAYEVEKNILSNKVDEVRINVKKYWKYGCSDQAWPLYAPYFQLQ
ncbi:plasmid mobilization relaxosome protein MobC [Niabella sp. W65]|nr:plasmid mobilization relaxosome protein MobC [Niabella sp. W65]MCH7367366.1 plasmid mobilization relaxosome protein MobC [Niabella sp. W65]ULT46084.1 plasmid mobilization relaxosome protein MobC [Niabella sp. I65]